MREKTPETGSKLLLELRVDENGVITLFGTEDVVVAKPLGGPLCLAHTFHPDDDNDQDVFTYRNEAIYLDAPKGANAFSTPRIAERVTGPGVFSWDDLSLINTPVQYYRVSRHSVKKILRRSGLI